jgi:hypothetical protein
MAKYRSKPVIVEAVQFDPDRRPWPAVIKPYKRDSAQYGSAYGYIENWILGQVAVYKGDWLVTKESGVVEHRKDAEFQAMYEPVKEES